MIVIVDCHVSARNGTADEFHAMLERLAQSREDLVFLGDTFELWIALRAYEDELHRRFLAWCVRQKEERSVGFVEGNHEFFVAEERGGCFSWCVPEARQEPGGLLLVHGDLIDRRDRGYRLLRRVSKSRLMKLALRCFPPGGKALVALASRGLAFRGRKALPEQELRRFAEATFARDARTILTGHFHRPYLYRRADGRCLHTVPAWRDSRAVVRLDSSSHEFTILRWQEV